MSPCFARARTRLPPTSPCFAPARTRLPPTSPCFARARTRYALTILGASRRGPMGGRRNIRQVDDVPIGVQKRQPPQKREAL